MLEVHSRPISRTQLSAAFWIIAAALGLFEACVSRHSMGTDGISYLDLGDAFKRGDWNAATNAHWSPLYPFLLGVMSAVFRPSAYWEFTVAHFTNFLIYMCAFACFNFFLTSFRNYYHLVVNSQGAFAMPEWAVVALGNTLFLWSALRLITISNLSPDMCVSAFIYLAAGILLRTRTGSTGWKHYVLLGLVLGVGYLAKAPMFLLSIVFLGLSVFASDHTGQAIRRVALAGIIFLGIASLWIFQLSRVYGRVTFGDSASLNYAWINNEIPKYYWVPDRMNSSNAQPLPAKKLFSRPDVYRFLVPERGTYPYWYDPARWFKGVHVKFSPQVILRPVLSNLLVCYNILFHLQPLFPFAMLALFLLGGNPLQVLTNIGRQWILLALALAGFGMFSMVLVLPRYLGPFTVMLLVGLFAALFVPHSKASQKALESVILGLTLFVLFEMSASAVGRIGSVNLREFLGGQDGSSHVQWQIADGLRRVGLQPGEKVAWLRPTKFSETENYWWARLARIQIVAEIPDSREFWSAQNSTRLEAIRSLPQAGVKALVVSDVPSCAELRDWARIGATGYYAYLFADQPGR